MVVEVVKEEKTLPESYKEMFQFLLGGSGIWAVIAVAVAVFIFKATLGYWTYLDPIVLSLLFIFRGVIEWGVHYWLYHAKPLPLLRFRLKTKAFLQHLEHHEGPEDLSRILVTYRGVLYPAFFVFLFSWLTFGNLNISVSIVFWLLFIGFINEVIHLICHCDIPHHSDFIKKIVWLHRRHHHYDSNNYYGLSSSLGDKFFGTLPSDLPENKNIDGKEKLWFAAIEKEEYKGGISCFFDIADVPIIEELETRAGEIKNEILVFISRKQKAFTPYFGRLVKNSPEKWITHPLRTWGLDYHVAQNDFPVTCETIKKIPGVVSVSFNILSAGGEIPEHFGDTNATNRVHLGLVIPAGLPVSGIKVGEKAVAWEEGKATIFCDAHRHKAWNHSEEDRLILLMDVIRPEFMPDRRKVCSIIITSFIFQLLIIKAPILQRRVVDNSRVILGVFAPIVSLLIPVYNMASYLVSRMVRAKLRLMGWVSEIR